MYSEGYEIVTVNIDGTDRKRLTNNERFDHYPVWSPDGTQVAIVADMVYEWHPGGDSMKLVIISPDVPGRDTNRFLTTSWVALYPPVWSPDGQRLAFVADEGEMDDGIDGLYVMGSNSAGQTRIGATTAAATWSPDGEELAFASMDGDAPIIYAVRPDGTGLRTVWRGEPSNPLRYISPRVSQVSWSPDGSELLFLIGGAYLAHKSGFPIPEDSSYSFYAYYTDEAYLVRADGTDLRRLASLPSRRAAWSPDGSRIAIYQPGRLIISVSRDGTDLRFLTIVDEEGRLRYYGDYGDLHEHFIHWAGGGTHLVFDHDDLILALDIASAQVREVADADVDYQESDGAYRFDYGFYADVSPDGSRIVYSTCGYMPDEPGPYGQYSEGYEIAMVNIDGTDKKRLTTNERFDHYPVWSPDGTQVAIVANISRISGELPGGDFMKLVIISPDVPGRDTNRFLTTRRVALYPPVWSPDGQRLAFIADEGEFDDGIDGLYVMGSNSAGQTRIGATTAAAAWSPDGKELAFASIVGDAPIIYAVRPDGTGLRTVWRGESPPTSGESPPTSISLWPSQEPSRVSQVSWSPDGSELLFLAAKRIFSTE